MITPDGWSVKTLWRKSDANFCVEISQHCVQHDDNTAHGRGPYRWCVYLYVYPKHPWFNELMQIDTMMQVPQELQQYLHSYCSYFKKHSDGAKVTSIQIGADYDHLHDEKYTYIKTAWDATEIFSDAQALFDAAKRGISLTNLDTPV